MTAARRARLVWLDEFGRNYSALASGRNGTGSIATVTGGVRKLHVKSYGCQMNVYDSHRMTDLLAREGYAEAGPEEADQP